MNDNKPSEGMELHSRLIELIKYNLERHYQKLLSNKKDNVFLKTEIKIEEDKIIIETTCNGDNNEQLHPVEQELSEFDVEIDDPH